MRTVPGILLAALVLAGCGVSGEDTETDTSSPGETTSTTNPTTTSTTGAPTTSESEMPEQDIAAVAIQDLAARLDVSEQDVEIVEVRDVQWPDGALGCPEEGKFYTQAVVDGTRVLLGADDRIFDYHAGDDGEPFLCESEEKDGSYEFVPPPTFDE